MTDLYTGVRVHSVKPEIINELYNKKEIQILDKRFRWPQNLYLVIKDECGSQQSALGRVKGDKIVLLRSDNISINGVTPRNKEQRMALDSLLDDSIKVVSLTGRAGSGKTLLSLAVAMHKSENKIYDKIIFCKNTIPVGKEMGFLPGDLNDKFMPYNQGALCNFEYLLGNKNNLIMDAIEQYRIDFLPTAVIRGSSWHNALIIVDEVQNLDRHEVLTLGTRIAEGSKLVLLGDLAQIDAKIKKDNTGIFSFVNHQLSMDKSFVSHIHLIKDERSEVSKLFSDVFSEE
jgi:PhoH-like ATPase